MSFGTFLFQIHLNLCHSHFHVPHESVVLKVLVERTQNSHGMWISSVDLVFISFDIILKRFVLAKCNWCKCPLTNGNGVHCWFVANKCCCNCSHKLLWEFWVFVSFCFVLFAIPFSNHFPITMKIPQRKPKIAVQCRLCFKIVSLLFHYAQQWLAAIIINFHRDKKNVIREWHPNFRYPR